jgi:hypothetical protein
MSRDVDFRIRFFSAVPYGRQSTMSEAQPRQRTLRINHLTRDVRDRRIKFSMTPRFNEPIRWNRKSSRNGLIVIE